MRTNLISNVKYQEIYSAELQIGNHSDFMLPITVEIRDVEPKEYKASIRAQIAGQIPSTLLDRKGNVIRSFYYYIGKSITLMRAV